MVDLPRAFRIDVKELQQIVKRGDLESLKSLVLNENTTEFLKEIDASSQSLLHVACYAGCYDIVDFLLKKAPAELINYRDKNGWTALHCAAEQGHLDICVLLLSRGADATITTNRQSSPLHYLARVNMEPYLTVDTNQAIEKLRTKLNCVPTDKENVGDSQKILRRFVRVMNHKIDKEELPARVVQMMIDRGANINARNQSEETPLMQACFKGWKYNFFLLLSKGAYAFCTNKKGITCFDYALSCEHYDIVAILRVISSLFKWVPKDVIREIFSYLDGRSLARVSGTCRAFKIIADQDSLWESLVKRELPYLQKGNGKSWKQAYLFAAAWSRRFGHLNPANISLLREHFDEADRLYKVIIVGDSGTGKSSLLLRFVDDTFTEAHISTIGVDFKITRFVLNGVKTKLQIWDTPSYIMDRFRTRNVSGFYRGAQAAIVCFDVTDMESWSNVKHWLDELDRYAYSNISILVVGCKGDLVDKRTVEYERAKEYCDAVVNYDGNPIVGYMEVSAKHGVNVNEAFGVLTQAVTDRLSAQAKLTTPPPQKQPDKCSVM